MEAPNDSFSPLYRSVLPAVMDGIANSYGQAFFERFVLQVTKSIYADYVFIGRISANGQSVNTLAVAKENNIIPNFSYALKHTPCEKVMQRCISVYPDRVAELFPKDELLAQMDIQGYLGTPLYDRNDNMLGIVVGLYCQPIEDAHSTKALFELLSGRIAAEIESTENVRALEALNNELESRIQARTSDLASANNNLKAFAHSVSHDLKAPVRAIIGFSEAIEEDYGDSLPEEALAYLQMINANASHMQQLIDDMLSLARASETDIHRQHIDVSQLCDAIIERLKQHNPERITNIQIQRHIHIDGDKGLCQILFTNLLSNAWKYSQQRDCCQISVSQKREQNMLSISIGDNGVGFDTAHASDIFVMFQRLHLGSDFEGSGIGLATVKRILDKHGADISYQSEPDKGAVFTIHWPMEFH